MRRRRVCHAILAALPIGLVGCTDDGGDRTPEPGTDRSPATAESPSPTPTNPPTETPSPTPEPNGGPDNVHQPGDQFTGPLEAVGWKATNPRTADSLGDTTADGTFVIVYLNADELVGETVSIERDVIRLVDDNDRTYAVDSRGMAAVEEPFEFKEIYPGIGTDGNLVFDVPAEATGLRLRIGDTNIHYVELGLDEQ
jgi:hypothetical protein